MERQRPDTTTNEIALYLRTIFSLLRSSGEVRVRSLEEAHSFSNSSLHPGAREAQPDVGAFGYAAARLPECMPFVKRVVLGQSDGTFGAHGLATRGWARVRTRGRRRHLRWDGKATLAAYATSTSDIDDLVPILTAYQIEWNKLHDRMTEAGTGQPLASALGLSDSELVRLREALGADHARVLDEIRARRLDLRLRLLAGSFAEYERAAHRWWEEIERLYAPAPKHTRAPVYFVSSNTHALANLLGGFALAHQAELAPDARANALYYALRTHLHADPHALARVQAWDAESGIVSTTDSTHVDVEAQVIELAKLRPERLDPRVRVPGLERLAASDAKIVNLDYPLGLAAYHLLARVSQGTGPLLGVYVMGKAATLNGQVGDVMISRCVHDEHSSNTYLLRNGFGFDDVAPWLETGSVLDNQKAVTVRGAFLQNASYMGVFYREGYTVLEMEAGPYLSALYEAVDPRRHPNDEIVDLSQRAPFDIGILHYASDTPYSRRQSLLSRSMGEFGMDATYACAIAITRRILAQEVARLAAQS